MSLRLLIAPFAFLALTSCATVPKSGGLETLKPVVEAFHTRIRWRDYRGTTALIVPERREAFERARREKNDHRDLTVTDYQLEDVRLFAGGLRALVVSRVQWVRLPSVTENSDQVTSEFVFLYGAWLLARQDSGPFVPELQEPYELPDAG